MAPADRRQYFFVFPSGDLFRCCSVGGCSSPHGLFEPVSSNTSWSHFAGLEGSQIFDSDGSDRLGHRRVVIQYSYISSCPSLVVSST